MGYDGYEFDPEILKRVWGEILPIAADDYDNAIERMSIAAPPYNRVQGDHVLEFVESAWRSAINDAGNTLKTLQHMQQTILATADAVRYAMDQYVATDQAAAARLDAAHANALADTWVHPVEGQP
jgi:hypothetical protein